MSDIGAICAIASETSERFYILQRELALLEQICGAKTLYMYKYDTANIPTEMYEKYYGLMPYQARPIPKLEYFPFFPTRAFAVVLNHIECLKHISNLNPNNWSIICEDDIFIEDKTSFENKFWSIFNGKPSDADILWISSGKKNLNCTYRDMVGKDPDPSLNYDKDKLFYKIPQSRYADCILIKNSAAHTICKLAEKYKINYPIDWEYNFWLIADPSLNSYWVQPAIIQQNPKFL
jgi:hypothetical protein